MSIRRLATLAAVAALGLLALGSSAASATSLRSDPGNILQSGAQTLRATSSGPAVLAGPAGTVTCQQALFDADINATTAATLTGRLTALTFTSCTDTILAINIRDCTLHAASFPTVSVQANDTGGFITLIDPVVRCAITDVVPPATGPACYYTAPLAVGQAVNASSTIAFVNVGVVGVTPTTDAIAPSNCGGSPSTFNVQLRHIVLGATSNTVTITT